MGICTVINGECPETANPTNISPRFQAEPEAQGRIGQ